MMIVPALLQVTGAAVMALTATLSVTSCRNMIQTYQEAAQIGSNSISSAPTSEDKKLLLPFFPKQQQESAVKTVQCLARLNRKQLLQVYLHATQTPAKDDDDELLDEQIRGEWNGLLLENNGQIMTFVSRFLSNSLFGNGRAWNGKVFGLTDDRQARGINRFDIKDHHHHASSAAPSSDNNNNIIDYDHYFDYQVEPSRIAPRSNKLQSIVLRYGRHQSFESSGWKSLLWNTMMDELRLLKCQNGEVVLLGVGCMAWSGGMKNGSPFCLYPATTTTTNSSTGDAAATAITNVQVLDDSKNQSRE